MRTWFDIYGQRIFVHFHRVGKVFIRQAGAGDERLYHEVVETVEKVHAIVADPIFELTRVDFWPILQILPRIVGKVSKYTTKLRTISWSNNNIRFISSKYTPFDNEPHYLVCSWYGKNSWRLIENALNFQKIKDYN